MIRAAKPISVRIAYADRHGGRRKLPAKLHTAPSDVAETNERPSWGNVGPWAKLKGRIRTRSAP
jgi:hypothetical protein